MKDRLYEKVWSDEVHVLKTLNSVLVMIAYEYDYLMINYGRIIMR